MLRSAPNLTALKVSGALISKMDSTQHDRGWVMASGNGLISVMLADQAPKEQPAPDKPKKGQKKVEAPKVKIPKDTTPMRAIKVATVTPLPTNGQWDHLFFTYDGSGRAAGVKIYVNGAPVATRVISDTLARNSMRTSAPLQLGRKSPDEQQARDTRYQDLRLYARALTEEEAKRLPFEDYVAEITSRPTTQWNRDQWHAVTEFYFANVDEPAKAMQSQIEKMDAELDKLSEGGDVSLVAQERPAVAYADILTRGVYTARKERVEANTPHFLPPLPAGEPHNRLALAEWTVSPENPLTARVTVNRMWNELFGAGLVETTEDFGIMGQRPSHPELLDWLAVEFRESGWDMKHMYKLMVMSAAYRQSAKVDSGSAGPGSEEPSAGARPALPYGCRDASRHRAAVQRAPGKQGRRPEREAVSARQCVGVSRLSHQRHHEIQAGSWGGALSAQPLHLLEAHGDAAQYGCL